ncbi:DUF4214 domain-containing protein [Stutzerimonas stutzeri]|uniref:DUF4214 domain-containing protein n=1 Tax=Stutzerimonas stutzeri TaxID=316 RepID=UPI003EE2DB84
MATASDLQQLYVGYFGRAADQEGLNFWLEAINNGGLSLDNVHASFVQSAEYVAQYDGLSSRDLVAEVYLNVLGRTAEAEGLAFWADALDSGAITEDQLIEGLLSGLSASDALIVSNKVTVANYYTAQVGAAYSESDKAASGAILDTVDARVASVSAALTEVAKVTGVTNSELAVVLAALESASDAQVAYAETVMGLAAGKATSTTVNDATLKLSTNVTNETTDLNIAIGNINVSSQQIVSGDTRAVVEAKLAAAQTNAATSVTNAQAAVNGVTGLAAAAKNYATAVATFDSATKEVAATDIAQKAALASFNEFNGTTASPLAITATGVTGVIAIDATTGAVSVLPAYSATATASQLAAANTLVTAISADLAADKALATAGTGLQTAVTAVQNIETSAVATTAPDGKLNGGLVAALETAKAEQVALTKAVGEYNDAVTAKAQFDELTKAISDVNDDLKALGFELVDAATATDGTDPALDEVFVFNGTGVAGAATINFNGDDVLFVGTGYSLGADSDLVTPGIQGGNNAVLEVFFVQAAASTVQVHIETSAFGSSVTGTPETNVITLTGVTSVDQLSFDASTGLVSLA